MYSEKEKSKKGTTRGSVFKELAKMRLEDANILIEGSRCNGAVYLSGYAVECALKWAITERVNSNQSKYLDEKHEHHNLDSLLRDSGLLNLLKKNEPIYSLYSAIVDEWGPQGRYSANKISVRNARTLYKQARQVYECIIEIVS